MNNTEKCIEELLTSTKLAAPKMTCPLKEIGNGNMLHGLRKIHNHGFIRGTITGGAIVCGVLLIGYSTYKMIKPHIFENHLQAKSKNKVSKPNKEELQCQRKRKNGMLHH